MHTKHLPPSPEGLEQRTNPKEGLDPTVIIAETIAWGVFANLAESRGINPIAEEYNGVDWRRLEIGIRAAIPFPGER